MFSGLVRRGFTKGLLGGSRGWLVVGIAAVVVRAVARSLRREEEVLLREQLPQGASLLITNGGPAPKVVR